MNDAHTAAEIGKLIRARREALGLSQRALSCPGVSYAYISRGESGAACHPCAHSESSQTPAGSGRMRVIAQASRESKPNDTRQQVTTNARRVQENISNGIALVIEARFG